MTREEAINKVRWGLMSLAINKDVRDAFEMLIPELRESEDEKIRKKCIELIKRVIPSGDSQSQESKEILDCIVYLEKQKEQNHSGGCFTCDEYKKGYEEGRRNGFTAGYNKAMKEAKQKDQKPDIELIQRSWYLEGYQDKKYDREPMWLITTGEDGPKYELNPKYGKKLVEEQKPAEWSEKDKTIIEGACYALETYGHTKLASMLKSLSPYWKPNEEQMEAFRKYIEDFQEKAEAAVGGWDNFNEMICLYEQLKKL